MADEELTTSEIYNILSKPTPSAEDLNKVIDFISKAGSPWLAGVPNDFMEQVFPKYNNMVELGKFDNEECENIIKNLQAKGATDALQHLLNDSNTPNGDSAITYLTRHALSAQHKADRGRSEFEAYKDAQINLLKTLADLKDADGNNIVNFATENKLEQNLKGLAKSYTDGAARRNASLPAGSMAIPDPARDLEQFFTRVDEDAEKYQTNIGSLEETAERTPEQLPENVANLNPNELEKGKDKSKAAKDYKFDPISKKPIIDYLYEDIFLKYLNMATDFLLKHLRNAVDRYADWCRKSSDELDRAAEKMKKADCKAATKKISAEYGRVQAVRDMFAETREDRRDYMGKLNEAIKRNLIEPVAGASENWEPLDINNPADKQMIESLKRSSQAAKDAGSDEFAKTFAALETKSNQDTMLEWQEKVHDLGYMLALTDWKHECLNDKNLKCLTIDNLSEDKDFQAKVLKYAQVVEAGVAAAMAIDMLNDDTTYTSVQNFLNNTVDQALKLEKTLDKDIKAENFKANPDDERRPTASNKAYKEFAGFIDDTVKFAGSAHILPHHPMYEPRSVNQEAAAQIYEIANSPHSKEQMLVNASLAATEAALQTNQQRRYNFQKLKEKLFGSKDNKFYQLITTNTSGGRS
ncbi:MAG: hypothetical protein IJ099_01275 [Alphaproteobacteria bacterium]|nr:hypothetical protein [Alphaproteobacteria bacterium]